MRSGRVGGRGGSLSAEEVARLGRPFVADGFLRLDKPALAHLARVLSRRRGTGFRDLTVLRGVDDETEARRRAALLASGLTNVIGVPDAGRPGSRA